MNPSIMYLDRDNKIKLDFFLLFKTLMTEINNV